MDSPPREPPKKRRLSKDDKKQTSLKEICVVHSEKSKGTSFTSFNSLTDPRARFDQLKELCIRRQGQTVGSPYRMDSACSHMPVDFTDEHGYHRDCYQLFTGNQNRLKDTAQLSEPSCSSQKPVARRSSQEKDRVIFNPDCIFCNVSDRIKVKEKGEWKWDYLAKFEFGGGKRVQDIAETSNNDILRTRIRGLDLFAVEAQFHPSCRKSFVADPSHWRSKHFEKKRRQEELENAHKEAYMHVCDVINRDIIQKEKILKLSDLRNLYITHLANTAFPNPNYRSENLKKKIQNSKEYIGKLVFTSVNQHGLNYAIDLVYSSLLNTGSAIKMAYDLGNMDMYREVGCDLHEMIVAAFKDSRDVTWPPTPSSIQNAEDLIPSKLRSFLNYIISGNSTKDTPKLRRIILSIGQDICRAATNSEWKLPKHILLCITLRHMFRSAQLTTMLNRFGHCESYTFSLELETAIANAVQETSSVLSPQIIRNADAPSVFHSEFDNFDQLINNLAGAGSIHTAHGIMMQDFAGSDQELGGTIPEIQPSKRTGERSLTLEQTKYLPECFVGERNSPQLLIERLVNPQGEVVLSKVIKKQTIWIMLRNKSSKTDQAVPGFGGFISTTGDPPSRLTTLDYYPVINQPITDYKTVQECLRYAEEGTKEVGQKYVITTFDLGVCMKAYPLVWNHTVRYKDHIILIGTFHLACAYMRVMGLKMEGSGLSDVLLEAGLITSGSLHGVLSGKHYERALHCHKTMMECLERLLLEQFMMERNEEELLDSLPASSCCNLIQTEKSLTKENLEKVTEDDALNTYTEEYLQYKREVRNGKLGKTAQFWITYIDHVWLVLTLIEAVKENDLDLYSQCLHVMSGLFFSFGGQNYARYLTFFSVYIANIEKTHPGSTDLLERGAISVARSFIPGNRCAVDKTMEETFMRHAKSHGGAGSAGLTGILTNYNSYQRWVRTTHVRTQFKEETLNMADMLPESQGNVKHHDLRPREIQRSEKCVEKAVDAVKSFLNPFEVEDKEHLYCISSGAPVPLHIEIDIMKAEEKGECAKQEFIDNRLQKNAKFFEAVKKLNLKRFSDMNKTAKLQTKSNKVIEYKQQGTIAFTLLIQSQMQGIKLDLQELMAYPLTPVPYSIGTADGFLAKTNKSKGYQYLTKGVENAVVPDDANKLDIEDGNASFYCMREVPATFCQISHRLLDMVPRDEDVIFSTDMYSEKSVKSMERKRRGCGDKLIIKGPSTKKPADWKRFLSHDENKQQFIQVLSNVWSNDSSASRLQGREVTVICDGTAYNLTSEDGKVTKREEVHQLKSSQEETDSRVILYCLYANTLGYDYIRIRSPDSDIFFILLHYAVRVDKATLLFDTGAGNHRRLLNVKEIARDLPQEFCTALLAMHAFSGCDSTSAFKGIGKMKPIKTLQKRPKFVPVFAKLGDKWDVDDDVYAGLEEFTCALYGCPRLKCVNEVRYCKIKAKCDDDNLRKLHNVDLGLLPPCRRSLIQHVNRVNYQVAIWKRAHEAFPEIPQPDDSHGWDNSKVILEPLWFKEDEILPKQLVDILETVNLSSDRSDESDSDFDEIPPSDESSDSD